MKKLKHYLIELDGIDKTGKDTIERYIAYLGKFKYVVNVRGVLSQLAYAELYNRDYDYDLSVDKNSNNLSILYAFGFPSKNKTFVLISVSV